MKSIGQSLIELPTYTNNKVWFVVVGGRRLRPLILQRAIRNISLRCNNAEYEIVLKKTLVTPGRRKLVFISNARGVLTATAAVAMILAPELGGPQAA